MRMEDLPPESIETDLISAELKKFAMTVGQKLESFLRMKLPQEQLCFETFAMRWVSSEIKLQYDVEEFEDFYPHLDEDPVYLNSVFVLYGDGTLYGNSSEGVGTYGIVIGIRISF